MNLNIGVNSVLFGLKINNTSRTRTNEIFTTEQLAKLNTYSDNWVLNIGDTTAGGNAKKELVNRKYNGFVRAAEGSTKVKVTNPFGTLGIIGGLYDTAIRLLNEAEDMLLE